MFVFDMHELFYVNLHLFPQNTQFSIWLETWGFDEISNSAASLQVYHEY